MPRKSLWVPVEDVPIWEAAERLSNVSLSALVGTLLTIYVTTVEPECKICECKKHPDN